MNQESRPQGTPPAQARKVWLSLKFKRFTGGGQTRDGLGDRAIKVTLFSNERITLREEKKMVSVNVII